MKANGQMQGEKGETRVGEKEGSEEGSSQAAPSLSLSLSVCSPYPPSSCCTRCSERAGN